MEFFRGKSCESGNAGGGGKRLPSVYGKISEIENACDVDVEDRFGCGRVIDDPVFCFMDYGKMFRRFLRVKNMSFLRDGKLF